MGGISWDCHIVTGNQQYDMALSKSGKSPKIWHVQSGKLGIHYCLEYLGKWGKHIPIYQSQNYGAKPSFSWMDMIYPVNWIELVAAQTSHCGHCASIKWQLLKFQCGQISKNLFQLPRETRHTQGTEPAKSKRKAGNMDLTEISNEVQQS